MCDICEKRREEKSRKELDDVSYRITPKGLLSLCTNDSYDRLISYMERNKINGIVYDKKELHWVN